MLSPVVGGTERGKFWVLKWKENFLSIKETEEKSLPRPKVYFEEWDEPMISGIRWVSELVGIAGGEDVFSELSHSHAASGRVIADPRAVVERRPDVILGSWCGKKFSPERVATRPGWDAMPAVRDGELHEIKSAEILQPGPPP